MGQIEQQSSGKRRTPPESSAQWKDYAAGLLPVAACFLGGATEKWAEGIVVAILGLLLLVNPPRFSLGAVFHGVALALAACAATAYLPARWFFVPAWRTALLEDFGVKIASTVSPQPWLTTGCLVSFLAGMGWLYYIAGQDADQRAVRRQLRTFASGIILLAGVAVLLYLAHRTLPFWHNQRGFGPFPNRNQTADLLGVTAVVLLACGQDDLRQGRKRWLFWLVGLALVMTAIFLNFSRAGILILVAGSVLWLGFLVLRGASAARIAIGVSALLVLLTVLLIFGGQTLERFNLRAPPGTSLPSDFRWLIFQDTLDLIRASPWCGLGLGNFQPVFAIFRDASVGQSRALHPESDWLWLAAELGWPGVILVLVGMGLLVWRVFPVGEGTNQRFRIAALIGSLLFALHGLVDVSGHRVGTALAGLFLFGLGLRRPLPVRTSTAASIGFRALGMVFLVGGATWTVASQQGMGLPGGIGVEKEKQLAAATNVGRNYNETIVRTTRALQWAPLDWQLYFLRALGKIGAQRPLAEALDDFRRARFLEPNSFEVPYQEGLVWVTREPLLALTAWREALRRAGKQRPELYGRMLSSASTLNPALNRKLEEFGSVQPDLALTYLERAIGEDFSSAVRRLLQHDAELQTLTPAEKARLFALWSERGDLGELAAAVESHPDWVGLAWPGLAHQRSKAGDFAGAFGLVRRWGTKPALPEIRGNSSNEQLQSRVLAAPSDYAAGFELSRRQMEARKMDDALITLRRCAEQPGAPAYFHFLEAEAWAAKENWERAWAAWKTFDAARGK